MNASNEVTMEHRIIRLESDVSHIQKDVAEIKTELKTNYPTKSDLKAEINGLKVWTLTWLITLHIASFAAIFGVMAKGFKWI